MKRIEIIYILSSGHSGSTLLNLVLGTHKNAISLGELKYLKSFVFNHKEKTRTIRLKCDCGKYHNACFFWSPVLKKINFQKLYPIQEGTLKRLEFIKQAGSIKNYEQLYKEISNNGENVIIDSSKDLTYLHFLLKSNKFDIKVLQITRDGRGVINSHEKIGYSTTSTYFSWLIGNLVSKIYLKIKLNKKNVYSLSYDLFTYNPKKYIQEINKKFNLNISKDNFIQDINKLEFHNFGGNLMRWKKIDSIKYDQSWKKRMPKWKQFVLTILCYIPNKLWVYNKK
mgnify:CR=1 FL=1